MEIKSRAKWPASSLSNFAPHPFILDGVECMSMEGFLQGLKFKSPEMQVHVCTLVGRAAKSKGSKKNWQRSQMLWWRGEPIARRSERFQDLLDRAFKALSGNGKFQKALLASVPAVLKHSMGKNDQSKTVLTVSEFCGRLTRIREELQKKCVKK